MDKNAIKKYAVWARRELIERVSQRAMIYGITAKDASDPNAESVNGHLLSRAEKRQRQALIRNIKAKGYEQVMEEVAYTWFNRFAALRFMEVNGYLPSHIRVFTNDAGEFKPQILAEAIHLELDGLDMNKVYELESANKSEELFKYLLIVQCNALNSILPGMFQRIEDYTELLFPDYLLREGSVIDRLINDIPEGNFDVRSENGNGQIEIIGWLYQYYISEKHEEVVDPLHGKVVKKEEVPAATQLFTTDWVVRYLIDNSVGRYWIERNPKSTLADKLTYFVKPKNGEIKYVDETITPQDLSTFDPCVGSGHFLVYAFDVLLQIYLEYGYSEREAAAEIVKNNLYGLDIDGRAVQLAYFAVMMKARQYDRRFFTRGIQPHIYEIIESNTADRAGIEYFCGSDSGLKKDIEALLVTLKDAKEYGSILQMPAVDFGRINNRFAQLASEINIYNNYLFEDFQTLIRSGEIISKKYAVVATNPPYFNKFDAKLKAFIMEKYKAYSSDIFSVFIYRNFGLCKPHGYVSFMTPNVWMFIKSYEKLRIYIEKNKHIVSLIQMAKGAFFKEATVDVCAFILKNSCSCDKGMYFRLEQFKGDMETQRIAFENAVKKIDTSYYYERSIQEFDGIPEKPIAYWVSQSFIKSYTEGKLLSEYGESCQGMSTADNNKYLRFWHEVSVNDIFFGCSNGDESERSELKWYPINKGGEYRKWYGNRTYVVNYKHNGKELKSDSHAYIRNSQHYFEPFVTWSKISSGKPSFRFFEKGFTFADAGMSLFCSNIKELKYLMAILNSRVSEYELEALSPTMNYEAGHIAKISIIQNENCKEQVLELVDKNIKLMQKHWDESCVSWDFKQSPLLNYDSKKISECAGNYLSDLDEDIKVLKENEYKINLLFKEIYNFEDLNCEVDESSISINKTSIQRVIREFVEYAVGCMFGRYSLDVQGLMYAGGLWDSSRYSVFLPDEDDIIPICDDEYFEDDIVGRFERLVEIMYGEETLEENLSFIANVLGGKGSSREVIRHYFINEFYSDHLKMYQKRPIYWLFDSGKKNGFKCLIYMHRYQPDTIARIRTDYVHEQQSRYRTAIADLEQRINGASTSERVKLSKQLATLQAQAEEIRVYEEKIHHLADQMIKIDLDDGVKHNYEIFKDVLAKIK